MSLAAGLCLAAAALLATAQTVYARQARDGRFGPPVTSWLAWAYGAAALVAVGLHAGAPVPALALGALCAGAALAAAAQVEAQADSPASAPFAWAARAADSALIAGYVAFLLLQAAAAGPVAEPGLAFVALAGLGAVSAAWPALRRSYSTPGAERPLGWFLSSAAFGLASLAAMVAGLPWAFLVYPALAQVMGILIGLVALDAGESSEASGSAA